MDSASDLATKTRDPHNQAIYPVKRPANIFDDSISQVNDSKTVFNDIMDICGIEPGKKCDPTKSRMKHILMMTDGDIDGDSIAISVICLLAKHCKPLIDAGIVGRILPPAYSFPSGKGNKRIFVRSQREFFDKIMVDFVKNIKIGYGDKEFTNKELYDFLDKNFQYDKKLEKLSDRYCCDPKIMEYIARKYHGDFNTQKKSYWMEALKQFSGLNIIMENKTIILDGDIPGYEYMNLAFDEYFDRHVNRFKLYQSQNDQITGYMINGEKDKSVYDIMHQFRKYLPKDVKRYKGLGELDDDDIINLCMNRKTRTVVIYKFKNFEKDMGKINIIMSTKKEFAEARGTILMNISAADIDIDT